MVNTRKDKIDHSENPTTPKKQPTIELKQCLFCEAFGCNGECLADNIISIINALPKNKKLVSDTFSTIKCSGCGRPVLECICSMLLNKIEKFNRIYKDKFLICGKSFEECTCEKSSIILKPDFKEKIEKETCPHRCGKIGCNGKCQLDDPKKKLLKLGISDSTTRHLDTPQGDPFLGGVKRLSSDEVDDK